MIDWLILTTYQPIKCYSTPFAVSKVMLATVVEGDPKAPFSLTTTPRIAPLYPWSLPYNAEC